MGKNTVAGPAWAADLSDWYGELSECITKSAVKRNEMREEEKKSEMISWALPFMLKPKCEATRTTALKRMRRGVSPRWNKINYYLLPLSRVSQRTKRVFSLRQNAQISRLSHSLCSAPNLPPPPPPPLARPIFILFNHISFIAFIFLWFKIVFDGMALVPLAVVQSDVDWVISKFNWCRRMFRKYLFKEIEMCRRRMSGHALQ